ncbi:MAG: hypothetical protein ABR954_10595 [Dehalococcoidales bacterium]
MKKPTLDTETIFCQCLGESVAISFADDQPDEIYLSWWHQEGIQLTFWDRIRLAWNIVIHGQGWMDEIVLDHADTLRLIKALRRAVHVVWSEEEEERLRRADLVVKEYFDGRKANLFKADPHCYWCGREVINIKLKRREHPPENLATIDHLISRYDARRGKVVGVRVLSCWLCNHDRDRIETAAQGLDHLHHLSGHQPLPPPLPPPNDPLRDCLSNPS